MSLIIYLCQQGDLPYLVSLQIIMFSWQMSFKGVSHRSDKFIGQSWYSDKSETVFWLKTW